MKRSHKSLFSTSLIIALFAGGAVHAELQVDLRSGYLSGYPDTSHFQSLVRPAVDLDGTLFGKFALGKGFHLSFENHLSSLNGIGSPDIDSNTGAIKKLPATELNVPSYNYGGADLSYHGLRLGYRNLRYGRTPRLYLEYMDDYYGVSDSTFTYDFLLSRKMQQRLEGQYQFENDLLIADAALYHISTAGEIDSISNSVYHNSLPITSTATRFDLSGGVRIPGARMKFVGGGRGLIDHYGPSSFNSMDLFFLVGGDAAIDFHRLEYYLRSGYFSQGYAKDSLHRTTGFFQTCHLRGTFWIGEAFMVKGLSTVTVGRNLVKQRYGLSLRRPWDNGSFVEAGASTTMGGLFPLVDYFIQSGYTPVEPLSFSLRLKSVWDWPREDEGDYSKTLFVKAVWGGEVSYRIGSATEFYLAGDYTDFNSRYYFEFTSRLFMGGGLRFFLP